MAHNGKSYGSLHKTAVAYINVSYYDMDSNLLSNNWDMLMQLINAGWPVSMESFMPEKISKSYADYLRGLSNTYTSIN